MIVRQGRRLLASAVAAAAFVLGAGDGFAQSPAPPPPADAVFVNGKVFTANARSAIAQGFAVRNGRFVAVGSSEAMKRYVGSGTSLVDLHGRFVTPGLADGHFHNEGGGPGIDLSRARSLAELLAVVETAAKKTPQGDVIVSNNDWHEAQLKEKRLPLAKDLDAVAPNNPVVLVRGGHEMILNTSALKKWNITRDTASPAGGEVTKGADGEPNGELIDNAKQLVQLPPAKPVTAEDVLTTQRTLNAYGITSVRVPGRYKGDLFADYKLLKQVRDSGQLTLRYNVLLPGFGARDPARVRDMIVNSGLKQDEGDDFLRIGGVKLLVDGGFEGGHMSAPYAEPFGKGGTFKGIAVVPTANFVEVVKEVNRLGWRVATHAVGRRRGRRGARGLRSRRTRSTRSPASAGRSSICSSSAPTSSPRIKKLGLTLSVQDHLYLAAPVLKQYWGASRANAGHPGENLSRQQVPAGRRHRFAGDSVQPVLGDLPFQHPRHDVGWRLRHRPARRIARHLAAHDHHQLRAY